MENIIHLNILLGIMIIMLLDHYIQGFHKSHISKFDENKIVISLMVKDKQFLKNCNKVCKKIERLMSIDFDSRTTYGDDKYIKTKRKAYEDSITTNF